MPLINFSMRGYQKRMKSSNTYKFENVYEFVFVFDYVDVDDYEVLKNFLQYQRVYKEMSVHPSVRLHNKMKYTYECILALGFDEADNWKILEFDGFEMFSHFKKTAPVR